MSEINDSNTGLLHGGSVEYSMEDAAVSIDELIEALQNAKDNDLEYVVMSSGNYRGAKWSSIRASWSWLEIED